MTDSLSILRGKDYIVSKQITMRQPSLGEIEELNEEKYMTMLAVFVSTPFDMIAQLDQVQIDFTQITSYQLFCACYELLDIESTSLIFGDIDFSKFRRVECNNKLELQYKDIIIDEEIFNKIVDCLRTFNSLSPPKFKKVANEYTKIKMIENAYEELELAKRRKQKYKSVLKTLISRATNHPYFKYRLDEVWDLKIYAFYDSLKSISIIENSNHLMTGAYSGNLDLSKINKNELNWLREVND